MTTFELLKTANQKFSTSINDHVFEIELRTFRGITYCSVWVDGELKQGGARATPNTSLFCSAVNRLANGIFQFNCLTDNYPHFSRFDGIDTVLAYIPYGE